MLTGGRGVVFPEGDVYTARNIRRRCIFRQICSMLMLRGDLFRFDDGGLEAL